MSDDRRLLWFVRIFGPVTVTDLQFRLGFSPSKITRILRGHWRLELVGREPDDWDAWDVTERGRLMCPAKPLGWLVDRRVGRILARIDRRMKRRNIA